MAKVGPDLFVQYASISVTESAADTLTFQQLQTGGMLFERRAFVIHRIEYQFSAGILDAEADSMQFGLATNNNITAVALDDPNVLDYRVVARADFGTAASAQFYTRPLVTDFSGLPSGGILTPSHPIYGFAQGTSIGSAQTIIIKFYFTLRTLSPQEYIELVEALRVIT